jgi:tetratricopeptide (TPR) repeat protein
MSKYQHIFKKQAPPTAQELSDYLEGKLTDAQRHLVEEKMQQDEFHQDAADGFEAFPLSMKSFDAIHQEAHQLFKSKQPFWKFSYTIIIVAVLALGVTFLAPYIFGDGEMPQMKMAPSKPNNSAPVMQSSTVNALTDEEIDESEYLEFAELILPEFVISASPVVMNEKYKIEQQVIENEFEKAMEIKKIERPDLENITLPTLDNIVYSNVTTFYVHKFLMVDYSSIYTDQLPVQKLDYSGTLANLEDGSKKDELLDAPKMITQYVTYKQYLFETQELFAANNFKAALKRYNTILGHYPQDLNAHFYGGLCYFNLKQFNKAIEHFDKAMKHPYNTFQLDAQWYMARAYYMSGDSGKAKELLEKIVSGKDYYAKQAIDLLHKLP